MDPPAPFPRPDNDVFRRLLSATLLLGIMLGTATGRASAADARLPPASTRLDVVKVSGLIDPLNADLIRRAIAGAGAARSAALVVQLNSTGGVIGESAVAGLVHQIHDSPVPVTVWVGGSGRPRAYGTAFEIVAAAAFSGIGPGGRVGRARPLADRTVGAEEALANHQVDVSAPTLGDFVVDLDGRMLGGAGPLRVAEVIHENGQPRRRLAAGVQVAFAQLTVLPRVLHSAASPNVAYVMLLIALSLAVFEFFTAGVGVAAGTAALAGGLAAYGMGVLPTRPGAVALVAAGIIGFAIDVQSGAPRAWTVIGAILVGAGSVGLYAGGLAVSPWLMVLMGVLLLLFMVGGMPAMVRTRFSTPTIGRSAMVGAMGEALTAVDPDGTVEIKGARWRGRTNRATPIPAGGAVRVVAIDGLVLEVEPSEGGARDYRH